MIWAGIVIVTDFEVGFVAILVGWLAGKGRRLRGGREEGGAGCSSSRWSARFSDSSSAST